MKKIVSLIFVVLILSSLCACSGKGEETKTTTALVESSYEQALYGDWKRENSDITITLESGNSGNQIQGKLSVKLYWEADAETILIKTNMVGEQKGVPYTLSGDTLTINNEDGTKTVYKKVK